MDAPVTALARRLFSDFIVLRFLFLPLEVNTASATPRMLAPACRVDG